MSLQIIVFIAITLLIGGLTWWQCAKARVHSADQNKEYFLAGGGLGWIFVAGSITLTNLSTDQLVGMNGNQMLIIAWWELAAVVGLVMLALIFIPIYYRNNCTTTTELLERRYGSKHVRALIGCLFLLGNVFVYLPVMLYSGSLFMVNMFGLDVDLIIVAMGFAVVGAAYAVLGGLRAVAVSDTFSGVGLLGLCLVAVWLSLEAIGWDLSGIPAERLTLISNQATLDGQVNPIPWPTLLTGMLFIQMFYWSTNQTITQRAMAAPSVREAQKGVLAAAGIRLLIVPVIVALPGIVAFKLYGDIGDASFGRLVGDVLPGWMSGAFAAMMAAAVLTSFNSVLNSSAALYVCDIHEAYFDSKPNVPRLSALITAIMVITALFFVEIYRDTDSIINLVQKLNGLLSMPILSVFVVGLLFNGVRAEAAMAGVLSGLGFYAFHSYPLTALQGALAGFYGTHYIHMMLVTLILAVSTALLVNRLLGGRTSLRTGYDRADRVGSAS